MDPSRAGDLDEQQPGSDLPPDTRGVPAADPDGAGGALTVHTSSALRESEKQAWPEWARAGDSAGRHLEPRRTAAGEVGVSQAVIGWSPWRGRSRSPSPAVTVPLGAATVVAIAACTSLFVSLATVWLWGRTAGAVPPKDATPMIAVAEKPPVPPPPPEPTLAPLLVHPIGRPVALAPIIAAIKPDFPALPAFLAPSPRPARPTRPARSNAAAPRQVVTVPTHFVVTSDPAGANVTINGVGYGPTPVTIPFLPPGAKRIRVTKAGYQSQEQVVGARGAGSTPGVRIVLAELPGARGSQ